MSLDLDGEPSSDLIELGGKHFLLGGFKPQSLCIVTEDVIALHNGSQIKFFFLRSGRSRCFIPQDARGISTLCARDDLGAIAWSEAGPKPNVHVMLYGDPLQPQLLPGKMALNPSTLFPDNAKICPCTPKSRCFYQQNSCLKCMIVSSQTFICTLLYLSRT